MASEGPPKAKKQKVDLPTESGDASDSEDGNDKETQTALEAIDGIQNEIDVLNEKASVEILEVEQKYNKLRKPYYDKRNVIIERIPNFWLLSLLNHPQVSTVVKQEDKECLKSLNKVEVEEFDDIKSGYKLSFSFKPNPYFTNDVLCKEFHLAQTGDPKSKSTAIDWKDGMDLTEEDRKAGSAQAMKKRGAAKASFFTWFLDNKNPSLDGIAEMIKDDLWPNPLAYYLGEKDYKNGMDDSDDDDDELDESVVVVEDDDDEDEDEEVYEVEDEDDEELDTTGDVEVIEEDEVEAEDEDDEEDVEEIEGSREEEGDDDAGGKDKSMEDEDEDSLLKDDETEAV
ncbi:protein SET-like [Babylonia areolata]|uniref:protein SET-like n=1 Tax=Babylonia areolata TaxID=304850 RepID=UPI003FD20BE7